jgi:hypothetical protein
MTALNAAAKAALRDAGVTQTDWAREWFPCQGKPGDLSTEIGRPVWLGDACGCPDDRCKDGYHHDPGEDCGCLSALLARYDGPRRATCQKADEHDDLPSPNFYPSDGPRYGESR